MLDAAKTKSARNQLGQFATPPELARDMLEYAKALTLSAKPQQRIRFLDPAFGTGAFYFALLKSFQPSQIEKAYGYEIDPHFAQPSAELWADTPLKLEVADFTHASPPTTDSDKANLIICNPPYVRHHHLSPDEKKRLQNLTRHRVSIKLSGLAGLYCYFILLAHDWLAEDGLAGWLIPSEFMGVNYGRQIRRYLLQQVTLLHIHRFNPDNVQFGDALVSSAIVWFRKKKPPVNHKVKFSYGGTLSESPLSSLVSTTTLRQADKWLGFPEIRDECFVASGQKSSLTKPKLSDLFHIKRGLVTGANEFFILTPRQIAEYNLPKELFIPILPSPRYLTANEIAADESGNPILDRKLFLLNCNLPEAIVKTRYPSLWKYLQEGVRDGIDKRYLCRHRSPWYSQESRRASPFLCTYMGRISAGKRNPFRFILNLSKATAPNVYLMMYPKPTLARELRTRPELLKTVGEALDAISPDALIKAGRVYGGGLYKIEPQELANAPAGNLVAALSSSHIAPPAQLSLFK